MPNFRKQSRWRSNQYSNITVRVDNRDAGFDEHDDRGDDRGYNNYNRRSPGTYKGGVQPHSSHYRNRGGHMKLKHNPAFKQAVEGIKSSGSRYDLDDMEMGGGREVWCKVTIIYGVSCTRQYVMSHLANCLGYSLPVFNYRVEAKNVAFFLKIKTNMMNECRKAANSITSPNGDRMTVNVSKVEEPSLTVITPEIEEHIKASLIPRFNATQFSMDLAAFHKDTNLVAQGCYVPLKRGIVITKIVEIITENLPQLFGIDLSNNQLETLGGFSLIWQKFSATLRFLNVSGNQIRSVAAFESLKCVTSLEDVIVTSTPLARRITSATTLGSQLRESLPTLQRVNGVTLPATVQFELESTVKALPPSQLGYFPNDGTRIALITFVKEYYDLYDTQRQALLRYYTDSSVFSLACSYHDVAAQSGGYNDFQVRGLDPCYLEDSRNLLKVKDTEKRRKMVKQGPLHIVALLDTLPKSQHKLDSFTMDVISAAPNCIIFNLTGIFFETRPAPSTSKLFRSFSRTMIVLPPAIISQDSLFITNPTTSLVKKHTPSVNTPAPAQLTVPAPLPTMTVPSDREQMVAAFSRESGMKPEFSRKCLEDCQWNYQEAAVAFATLKNQGSIPREAFA